MIITICGSSRFKDQILKTAEELTLMGHIVLMPMVFQHADNVELSVEQKIQLDNLHKLKINMSEAIYIVNVDNYIGESTYGEIDWASKMGKQIIFLNEVEPVVENLPEEESNIVSSKEETE